MKKELAVEWYETESSKLLSLLKNDDITIGAYCARQKEILERAKEMSKTQIVDAFDRGKLNNIQSEGLFVSGQDYFDSTFS